MSLIELLATNSDPSEDSVRDVLSGHLCRCTGYQNIVDRVLRSHATPRSKSTLGMPASRAWGSG